MLVQTKGNLIGVVMTAGGNDSNMDTLNFDLKLCQQQLVDGDKCYKKHM